VSDVYWARSGHEHPVPKGFVGYTDKVSFPYVGDVGRAKQLLAEAGYRDEVSVPVTVNDKAQLRREPEVVPGPVRPRRRQSGDPNRAVSTQPRTAEGFRTLRRHRAAARDNAFISRGYQGLETPIGPKSYRRLDVHRMK
jgi:hypothetical protein